eukprot:COSAG05_NODE_23430_length_258_cov_0.647799_1_plen_56_part_01
MPGAMVDMSKLKVVELRKRLQDMGLDTSGLKAVLVKRLEVAMQESAPPSAPEPAAP